MKNTKKAMYDSVKHFKDTFTENNLSEELLSAQLAEFEHLKDILKAHYQKKQKPLRILDIGIGNARILKHLVPLREIWETIELYHGIDIAEKCVAESRKVIKELKIEDVAKVDLLDAQEIQKLKPQYDLIILTWFTAGNFYPEIFDANTYSRQSKRLDMSDHPKFTSIFRKAYNLLLPQGEIVIGSAYVDSKETRIKQEEAYKDFGWTVITDERDCFTATKDGWWSQRFTKERIFSYLSFIPCKKIFFTPLDDVDYAMMIRIKSD